MKIVVLDAFNAKIEIVEVDDTLFDDLGAEQILEEIGYSINNICYFTAPIEKIPVTITNIGFDLEFGCSNITTETNHYLLDDNGEIVKAEERK